MMGIYSQESLYIHTYIHILRASLFKPPNHDISEKKLFSAHQLLRWPSPS
jgi:hypothetical protein